MKIEEAIDKLRAICSKQEKAPADIVSLLKKWNVNSDDHQSVLNKLRAENFINDKRYAAAFTRDKIRFDHWGFVKIRLALQQKGIDRNVIEDVINAIDKAEYKEMIVRELDKKRKSIKGTPYEIWAKVARYGTSKGFEMADMEDFLDTIRE